MSIATIEDAIRKLPKARRKSLLRRFSPEIEELAEEHALPFEIAEKTLNAKTRKVIEDAEKGIGVRVFTDPEEMFKYLKSLSTKF